MANDREESPSETDQRLVQNGDYPEDEEDITSVDLSETAEIDGANVGEPDSFEREVQFDLEGDSHEEQVEYYLIDEIGYDPVAGVNLAGEVEVHVGEKSGAVIYRLEDDFYQADQDGIRVPLFEVTNPEILETSFNQSTVYNDVHVNDEAGSLEIGFLYNGEDEFNALEEISETLKEFEEDTGLERFREPDYSGL